jgi:hypothetical protein
MGLPIGVHLSADVGDERTLLELAYALEEARPFRRIQDVGRPTTSAAFPSPRTATDAARQAVVGQPVRPGTSTG